MIWFRDCIVLQRRIVLCPSVQERLPCNLILDVIPISQVISLETWCGTVCLIHSTSVNLVLNCFVTFGFATLMFLTITVCIGLKCASRGLFRANLLHSLVFIRSSPVIGAGVKFSVLDKSLILASTQEAVLLLWKYTTGDCAKWHNLYVRLLCYIRIE